MTGFLASVADLEEAQLALPCGVDVLDLKDPRNGALGAWEPDALRRAAESFGGRVPLSAPIGDMPLEPRPARDRVAVLASTGVDILKIGLFEGAFRDTVQGLAPLCAGGLRLVAVFFADRSPRLGWLRTLSEAGFWGAMLDTSVKDGGGLLRHLDRSRVACFVAEARRLGLVVGLAGSLTPEDIPVLLPLEPDYLGFRGALCTRGRTGRLSPEKLREVARRIRERAPAL